MPSVTHILRSRRRRAKAGKKLVTLAALILTIFIGLFFISSAVIFGLSIAYDELTQDLPSATIIEQNYGAIGAEFYLPPRIYDRTGTILLSQIRNPRAENSRWLSIDPNDPNPLPVYAVQASVSALDDSFWTHHGFKWGGLFGALMQTFGNVGEPVTNLTISERFVETAILPEADHELSPLARRIRTAMLANDLTEQYSRDQIISWYLNSADYGRGAHGIDAASLVYFNKHAHQLTLSEAALLASVPANPERNPVDDLEYSRTQQLETLERMREADVITEREFREARRQPLALVQAEENDRYLATDYQHYLWSRVQDLLGPTAHRSSLKITTTLDADLQQQAVCAVRSHLERMSGGEPGAVVPGEDGSSCVAAGLLPPVRPGDSGIDHNIGDWSLVVLDPQNGEILSAQGNIQEQRKLGTALYPIVYLTAFSRGYAPASMILDLPSGFEELDASQLEVYKGPVSMRTALVNAFEAAGRRVLQIAGLENVLRIGRQMGLLGMDRTDLEFELDQSEDRVSSGIIEMALTSGVIANNGTLVGERSSEQLVPDVGLSMQPIIIRSIQDLSGTELYRSELSSQPVLSAPLAYLLVDVLSDVFSRSGAVNGAELMDIGRPAGMILGLTDDDLDNWAIGFSPQRVVAVRFSAADSSGMPTIGEENGAAAVWHAIHRYAERDLPAAGWVKPIGVSEVEVCTPSGLLPTIYCPQVVRDVFIHGTEPSSYDTLYQPIRVNRETGKLATLFTPIDMVEERVYMIPPEEAASWAAQAGLERPPVEYDTLAEAAADNPDVEIRSPAYFDIHRGQIDIRGTADIPDLKYFRLQYGEGLNPTRWIQIGSDSRNPVTAGILETWDTEDLNGLFTLQLLVVNDEGQVFTSSIPVTIDNRKPGIRIVLPEQGTKFSLRETDQVLLEAQAEDDLSVLQVQFFVDGKRVSISTAPPYVYDWKVPIREGVYKILAKALDEAGNVAQSEVIMIRIER